MTPTWNSKNLTSHHHKRVTADPGCFEDLLGIAGVMSEFQYDQRSEQAVVNAWAEYEGECWSPSLNDFEDERAYYLDNELVMAVTDTFRKHFVTCFHFHFVKPHSADPGKSYSVGQRQLRYRDHIDLEEKSGLIQNLTRIKGV